jgi:hypothetical protein
MQFLVPKPPELIGLSYHNLTPDQQKIYHRWQYERHGERKRSGMKRYNKLYREKRALSLKQWRDANKEHVREYLLQWNAKNPDHALRYRAKQLANPEYLKKQALRQTLKQEKEEKRFFEKALREALKISLRLHIEERKKLSAWKRQTQFNPGLKISSSLRSRIRKQLKGLGSKKTDRTMEIIGCTIEELKQHLQSQFKGSMNWRNYGPVWHVDHIVPCSYFDLTKPEEIRRCYHFTNLRPLWAKANIRQADRRGHLTPSLMI